MSFKAFVKKIQDFFGFHIPNMDITPEREEEICEKIARTVLSFGLEWPVILMGNAYLPMSTIITQLTLLPASPLLEAVGIHGYEYAAFFEKKRNVKYLLDKIEQLRKEREHKQ